MGPTSPGIQLQTAFERVDHAFVHLRRSALPFTGVHHPEQLAVLCAVLDDHCASFYIERSSIDHQDAGYLVMSLFEKGAQTIEELKAAVKAALAGEGRRHG
jgi:hypothetical protein